MKNSKLSYQDTKKSNINKYDLGEVGRIKINRKLYKKEFWTTKRTLQPEDLLGAINHMLKIKEK